MRHERHDGQHHFTNDEEGLVLVVTRKHPYSDEPNVTYKLQPGETCSFATTYHYETTVRDVKEPPHAEVESMGQSMDTELTNPAFQNLGGPQGDVVGSVDGAGNLSLDPSTDGAGQRVETEQERKEREEQELVNRQAAEKAAAAQAQETEAEKLARQEREEAIQRAQADQATATQTAGLDVVPPQTEENSSPEVTQLPPDVQAQAEAVSSSEASAN